MTDEGITAAQASWLIEVAKWTSFGFIVIAVMIAMFVCWKSHVQQNQSKKQQTPEEKRKD